MSTEPRTFIFKPIYWANSLDNEGKTIFHVSGYTKDKKTIQLKVVDYTPFIFLGLPKIEKGWNKYRCDLLFKELTKEYGNNIIKYKGNRPNEFEFVEKKNLYEKKDVDAMFLTFDSERASRSFPREFDKHDVIQVPGVGTFYPSDFTMFESNIDSLIKFGTHRNIEFSNWMIAKEKIRGEDRGTTPEQRKFSTSEIDGYVSYHTIKKYEHEDHSNMVKYLSFDIECYSENHNSKIPDKTGEANECFMIGLTFGTIGETSEEKRVKYILTLHDPHDIPGVKIRRLESEADIFPTFAGLVRRYDPDVFVGYNTMKFDWDYMGERAKMRGKEKKMLNMSRVKGTYAELKSQKWKSGAYGLQEFKYVDCIGRINLDALIEIERNYRLPQYSLNAVSARFLGAKKDDIPHRTIFMLYQVTRDILPLTKEGVIPTPAQLEGYKKIASEILDKRTLSKLGRKFRSKLLAAPAKEFRNVLREAMTLLAKYCVKDTILPIMLIEKLNLWPTMEQMSNVMGVPISYMQSRGQQIKVLSQVYREKEPDNIIIPVNKKDNKSKQQTYQGATVFKAIPGFYGNIATLDFASLYPSIMIAFNMCYSTLVTDETVPDEECHIAFWSEHRGCGCIHDTERKKVKPEKVLCGDYKYRFRRVKYIFHEDGTFTRKYEGVLARMERKLLSKRKGVKKELAKAEARLKMAKGLCTEKDIAYYRKRGYEIIEKDSLSEAEIRILEVICGSLDAKQKAIKVSANSVYGSMGALNGFIPFLIGAACVTAMGRIMIQMAVDRIIKEFSNAELVYGDTDSCMMSYRGCNVKDTYILAEKSARIATHYLICWILGIPEDYSVGPDAVNIRDVSMDSEYFRNLTNAEKEKVIAYTFNPMDLEFENLYGDFFLLTKKRYLAHVCNQDGEIIAEVKKGNVLTRRDNCDYLKEVYTNVVMDNIMTKTSEEQTFYALYDMVHKLFTRQVPNKKFIIYMGVSDLLQYAEKKETKNGTTVVATVFKNKDTGRFDIEDPDGPTDPRLSYRSIPQALLLKKMRDRGDVVPPNTRLEIIYIENKDAIKQGDKAEDYRYFIDNRKLERMIPDKIHYLEKQVENPLTEVMTVRYPKERVWWYNVKEQIDKALECNIENTFLKYNVRKTKVYRKPRPEKVINEDYVVGWDASPMDYSSDFRLAPDKEFKAYMFRGKIAKAKYIVDSVADEFKGFDMEVEEERDIVNVCKRWLEIEAMKRIHKSHGQKVRKIFTPKQTGRRLLKNINIVLLNSIDNIKRGEYGKILEIHGYDEEDKEVAYEEEKKLTDRERKRIRYTFDIAFRKGKTVLYGVPRESITTFRRRDEKFLSEMRKARVGYSEVIRHINLLFSPFTH